MTIQEHFISDEYKQDLNSRILPISDVFKKLFLLLVIILGNFTGQYCFAKSPFDNAKRSLTLSCTSNSQKESQATLHRLPAPPPDNRPNIILIVLDDWRYDSYSC